MTVRELVQSGRAALVTGPPFYETHYEVCPRHPGKGEPEGYLVEDVLHSRFADRQVWLAFHSEGTMADPVDGEHCLRICIE